MQPIINPIYLYLMEVVDGISMMSTISLAVVGTLTAMGVIFFYLDSEYDDDETKSRKEKALKIGFGATIFLALISILTPTSKTITKMIIAQNITVDRVSVAQDIVVKVYEDIVKIMQDK